MKEAMYYRSKGRTVQCLLCPHQCKLENGTTGFCKVRKNIDGALYTMNYGQCSAIARDPIEKKPLYHFMPGIEVLSIGSVGCNLHCGFCQNWQLSQCVIPTSKITPEQILEVVDGDAICFTYSEPIVWYEFILETMILAHSKGLKNILVTNGFINQAPLEELAVYIDAVNIDLKGFIGSFYKKLSGDLETVKNTIKFLNQKCHVELTCLIIPGENDTPSEMSAMVDWIASIDPYIPVHFNRFYPAYLLKEKSPTPAETLAEACRIAKKKLAHVHCSTRLQNE